MTVDELVTEARRNRTGPPSADALSLISISEFLRFALGHLLEDIDYEANQASGAAVAARVLATIISSADEAASKAMQ